jgi:hypothetical protein
MYYSRIPKEKQQHMPFGLFNIFRDLLGKIDITGLLKMTIAMIF